MVKLKPISGKRHNVIVIPASEQESTHRLFFNVPSTGVRYTTGCGYKRT